MCAGSFSWMKVPKPDSLQRTLGAAASRPIASRHSRLALVGEVFRHPRVLEDERHVRARLHQPQGRLHLPGEDLQVEHHVVAGEAADIADHRVASRPRPAPRRSGRAGCGGGASGGGCRAPAGCRRECRGRRRASSCVMSQKATMACGQPGFGADAGDPARLVGEPVGRPVGLHVDRLLDARARHVRLVLVDQVVALDGIVGAEDARLGRAEEPRQVGAAPDVVVGVDDGEVAHGSLAASRISRVMAAVEAPSPMRATIGAMAAMAAVCGV